VSAGDTICVEIESLQVDSSRGLMVSRPRVTGLAVTDQPQLRIVTYDGAQADVGSFRIPAVPMIGPIGVAPEGEAVSTFRGGEHGGNMAVLRIGVGSRVSPGIRLVGGPTGATDRILPGSGGRTGFGWPPSTSTVRLLPGRKAF
jgi:acetamidase/formamidase